MKLLIILLLAAGPTHDKLLAAIEQVESGGNCELIADGGSARGPMQIHECFFKDAVEFDKSLKKYRYEDVTDRKVARLVVLAYWRRYCTKKRLGRAPTDEDRMRMVNGGPMAYKFQYEAKEKRLKIYVAKVKAQMEDDE